MALVTSSVRAMSATVAPEAFARAAAARSLAAAGPLAAEGSAFIITMPTPTQ
ncbi:MAG: hypothetical protein OXS29_11605 [bacterium]|nr:hypothetical protein [bacterium]MDE0288509.1 hypothetical protein [bacterium]MDE0439259.1 hypothetical protein [bacterium]